MQRKSEASTATSHLVKAQVASMSTQEWAGLGRGRTCNSNRGLWSGRMLLEREHLVWSHAEATTVSVYGCAVVLAYYCQFLNQSTSNSSSVFLSRLQFPKGNDTTIVWTHKAETWITQSSKLFHIFKCWRNFTVAWFSQMGLKRQCIYSIHCT